MSLSESSFVSWLASLGLVVDMANGAPETTALRGTWVASVAAEELGLDESDRAAAVFGALFRYLGCTSYASEETRLLGDEHEAALLLAPIDTNDPAKLVRAVGRDLGKEDPAFERALRLARFVAGGNAFLEGYRASHCEGAVMLAERLDVVPRVRDVLASLHERWDGRGGPDGLAGERIPVASRVVHLARESTVQLMTGADETGVVRCLAERASHQLDPDMCRSLAENPRFLRAFRDEPLWEKVVESLETSRAHAFGKMPSIDTVAEVFGDFADQKCPWFVGHARRVAELVAGASDELALDPLTRARLVRAAWLHDVGRVGVPNRIWQSPRTLGVMEWEKVRLHAYVAERICLHLDPTIAAWVGGHHERSDESGYARGKKPDLPTAVLAAADVLAALEAERPHRPRLEESARVRMLEEEVKLGRLPAEAVRAVLAVVGRPSRVSEVPRTEELTAREREVLAWVARGLSNKEVAAKLGISSRTVQAHTIHAYDKLGVRTRAGAALRASELGLLRSS